VNSQESIASDGFGRSKAKAWICGKSFAQQTIFRDRKLVAGRKREIVVVAIRELKLSGQTPR